MPGTASRWRGLDCERVAGCDGFDDSEGYADFPGNPKQPDSNGAVTVALKDGLHLTS